MTNSLLETHRHLSGDLLAQFSAPDGAYDEVREHSGDVRAPWKKLLASLDREDTEGLERRWEQSQQLIRENGIVFGAYLGADRQPRPWQLDPLPLLIANNEWCVLESALQQRAQLLELCLADLYGPQRLLKEGILPPEVLYLHPGPWRAMHGHPPVGNSYLNFYAADLARTPEGRWWVLADRCEAPSGIGFALENRGVISRMFPTEFRDCRVERLSPFFQTLQATMQAISPQPENPRVAILSEGPTGDNYFEDAYLARHLGYTLVEDGDLTVRNQRLRLKTLGGLLPIDVLIRRSESADCDPLELDGDSPRGVVGLLQAVRAGNVAVCNALGSGLVESPIMMAFMPRLCEFFLNQSLQMPGVATWWCGQSHALSHVLDNLDSLNVSHAFRNRRDERRINRRLRSLSRDRLVERIRSNPAQFIAQERVERSAVPIWRQRQFESAYLALRSYVVSSKDGYQVLAGGLARTSTKLDSLQTSVHSGEGSKDTWVLADKSAPQPSFPPITSTHVELRRSGADLPSRVAENVFWLGRYLERSESAVRLLRAVTLRLTSETDYRNLPDLPLLLRAMASQGQIEAGFVVEGIKQQLPPIDQALPGFVFNPDECRSVRKTLETTLSIAARVRDRLSVDSWRILLDIGEQFQQPFNPHDLTSLLSLTNQLILDLLAFSGMVTESVTRTQAYRFLMIGRRLERALQIISLIDNCFLRVPNISSELLESVLEISDSLMTYRSRYMANLQLSAVLDLILTDETNPRSLAYQLVELNNLVAELPRNDRVPNRGRDKRLAMAMMHEIRMVDVEAISQDRGLGDDGPLTSLLSKISRDLPLLSNAITHRYLVHAEPTHQLSGVEATTVTEKYSMT